MSVSEVAGRVRADGGGPCPKRWWRAVSEVAVAGRADVAAPGEAAVRG